jgi:hydrogenase maturation protein HypF
MTEHIVELPVIIEDSSRLRLQFRVQGVVQGVGFRPFVYALATRLGLSGFVYNDSSGVCIEVEGPTLSLSDFRRALSEQRPPLAQIEQITVTTLPVTSTTGFSIVDSESNSASHTLVSPDISICDDCLRELFDPNDRRYRYPFINCTNCGPRFTIIQDVPYDRPLTTMAPFELCSDCLREYNSPDNRRFHAQPNACPQCGPHLEFRWSNDQIPTALAKYFGDSAHPLQGEAALQQAQQLLIHGGIIAIKGIGGFHLACDARNSHAVARLRQLKSRGDKPFAIMARDLVSALQVAHADAAEITLLTSRERPIVLLKKRATSLLSNQLAPQNPYLGVMLPYSPLHHLLFAPLVSEEGLHTPAWLVMTSGNFADEPIVTDNDVALTQLARLADAFLLHNRAIHMPCDDSVVRVHAGSPLPIRRSRGYVPHPLPLPFPVPPILAVGGELKNTFCLAQDRHAFLSQHIGDMQDVDTLESFDRAQDHFKRLFRIDPEIIACDLHPSYLSSYWADEYVEGHNATTRLVKIQHHHAHIAALLAEQGKPDAAPVIGFSFDGTGYGTDGAIWGGEVLIADFRHFERIAYLKYFPLPGGDIAIRHPYRTALAALWAEGIGWDELLPPVAATTGMERDVLERQLDLKLNCVPTSSMGRLFDVIATIAGVSQTVTYEGQAAIELEALVDSNIRDSYRFELPTWPNPWIDVAPVLRAAVADALRHLPPSTIASRFHNAVSNLVVEMSLRLRPHMGINTVALSGGVFQNLKLLHPTFRRLQAAGFEVLVHSVVPPNDGGLALGQAVIAAAQANALER